MNFADTHYEWVDMNEENDEKEAALLSDRTVGTKVFFLLLSSHRRCTKKKRTSIQFYLKSNFPLVSCTYFAQHQTLFTHTKREIQNYK